MKTVAIISQKGGAGKTTVAIHLAVVAEQHGFRTAVFDLDPQASATSWADKRKSPTPAVVPAQASRLSNLLEQAADQSADLVLIDSAPNADSASLAAARVADLILIPCRPAAFDLDAIGTTLNLATLASKPAWVVLNAVPPKGKLGQEATAALPQGGVQVSPQALHQLVAFVHGVNDGRAAQEYDPKSRAASEIKAPDFSVLQFRLDFMRVFGRYPMKSHRNQWLVMPLHAPKVPYRTLISPQAILYEGYQPSYGQYVTCFLKGCVYNPLK